MNIAATYGRSLFALACGLFSGRWALMALGEVDYGLMGVVGGLTAFIAFFNGLLAGAIGRFYAFSVGQAKVAGTQGEGLEVCRQWFNSAVLIHTVLPLVLMAVGYPIGEYALRHAWLSIPPDRVEACVWVFRFVCISCFVGMVNVPFTAMYTAKQYIAELTIYSFVSTTLNVIFLHHMVTHPGVWLAKYALWSCLLSVVPQGIICLRAMQVFPECRFRRAYLWDWRRTKALCHYAGWQFFGCFGAMLRGQGLAILVNRGFGPAMNASMAVGTSLAGHCDTLSGSMIGAFSPAITNACGARDYAKMRAFAYRTCKIGTLLTLIFALPLALEIEEVLRLWLKHPPACAAGFCYCVLAMILVDKTAVGHMLAVNANGRIAHYQAVLGTSLILTLPIAWLFVRLGWGFYAIGYAMILTMMFCAWGRVWFARKLVGMSARHWLFRIFLPLVSLTALCFGIGLLPRLFMEASLGRLVVTGLVTEAALLPLSWWLILDGDERAFLWTRLEPWIARFRAKPAPAPVGVPALAPISACTGCSACKAACPRDAIAMVADSEGFLRPTIDAGKCVACHACERACPILRPGVPDPAPICFAARTRSEALRLASSSGGVFTELARPVLKAGGVVFGCVWEKPALVAIHAKAETEAELAEMRGSKYVQSDLRETFREAKAALLRGRPVLFSGTPCQIAGLNRFLGKAWDNLLTVEVICHGAPSPAVFAQYLKELTREHGTSPVSIAFRNKYYSWRRCSLVSAFADTSENREDLYTNRYIRAFLANFCLRPSCHQCAAREGKSGADVTIADFWGIEKVCPALDDDRGTSAVLLHTARGRRAWAAATDNLETHPVTFADLVADNPSYLRPVAEPRARARFMRRFRTVPMATLIRRLSVAPLPLRLARALWRRSKHLFDVFITMGGAEAYSSPLSLPATA